MTQPPVSPPKLSVIVPFHDLEEYLGACLESLAGQTLRDFEVIMVDDGSTDGGAVIAKRYAARDPRFTLVQQEGQGPGPARNTGIEHARGEYLAFADGDDVLAPYAYELMVGSLEKTGSDLVSGNVRRFDAAKSWPCWLHHEACATTRTRTHISRDPGLLQDRTVWNKVFRRSFWDRHKLVYPHMLYEDPPVMIAAHVLADSVDVLSNTVYYWRRREGSITRRRDELANLTDRMESVRMVQTFLAERAPALKKTYDRYALDVDLGILTESLAGADEAEQGRILDMGVECLGRSEPEALRDLPVNRRLRFHLLGRRMLPELLEVLQFEKTGAKSVRMVCRGRLRKRWYAEYPFFDDPSTKVPLDVYQVSEELKLWTQVDEVRWQDGMLRLEGHANFERLQVARPSDLELKIWLQNDRGGRVSLDVERVLRPDVTADSSQGAVSYDWSGFVVTVDPARLKRNGGKSSTWRLHAEAAVTGLKRAQKVAGPAAARAKWPHAHQVDGRTRIQPVTGPDGFIVQVRREDVTVTGHRQVDGHLELQGVLARDPGGEVSVRASRLHASGDTGHAVQGPVTLVPGSDGTVAFTARLPLDRLVSDPDGPNGLTGTVPVRDGVDWDVHLSVAGRLVKPAVPSDFREDRYRVPGREFSLTRTRYGNLRAVERARRPVVTAVRWESGGRLLLTGEHCDPDDRPGRLMLRRRRSSETHDVHLTWDGDRFTAEIRPGAIEVFGAGRALGSGVWELLSPTGTDGEVLVGVERGAMAALPAPRAAGAHWVSVDAHQIDALLLRVRVAHPDEDRGAYNQRRVQEVDYPALRRGPLRETVVFDSYAGNQYSCNPRALYEHLQRLRPDLECVWASSDGRFTVPGDGRVVLYNSREHYEALAQSRYIVGNFGIPSWFVKRDEQTYLQTWHGTPLKRLAFDLADMSYRRTESLDWMDREVPAWDALVSPNPFTTPIMRRAFRYDGEILETGYPRNDILHSPDRVQIAARVRARLGIPAGKRVVLYAPTWRDDHHLAPGKRGFTLELDLERARAALGEDHVILIRTHYLISDRSWARSDGSVIDVSHYPDIAELYLVADALVTDYSSAMFDFAATGKPQLFFTYDLAAYRDHVRGFYLDFEQEAPGPLLSTSAEVIDSIARLDDIAADYTGAYRAFTAKYCPHDDGRASERLIERVFGPS
ncbi:bifunctional glycosyltransferase/CDP-glycerol:glycerophosphate glycerophosphotransferase [Spirillospora sp. NBC_01491]|uniref:bifunctional glycosyltransferase/CDP-glycerol:glycerophosphate glycerophosphotransferase n=1 Tax=Spirillospora sp. NBC_01491 TaxID=2976007 RepID=UPI002E34C4FE|nr:CDP-glycerol glycerophosphotransferase family protein [Spirillospora sp. NBC_01491]